MVYDFFSLRCIECEAYLSEYRVAVKGYKALCKRFGEMSEATITDAKMMGEINEVLAECGRQRELAAIVFDADPDCRAFSAGVAVEEHVEDTIFQMLDSFHAIFLNLEQIARQRLQSRLCSWQGVARAWCRSAG